ncbi:MAG: hypothetical protein AB4058_21490 [Microcystaceae cyanobacterium]
MTDKPFPARLHVLIARHSDKAIIIRRGPSKQTCIIGWDRTSNSYEVSQWLKGRIYERRSDISPYGQYWIYFALNGKWTSDVRGSWTAIARTPWLKAITLWAKGDAWYGGGLFLDDQTYWLNSGLMDELRFDNSQLKRHETYQPPNYYGGECCHVYYNRLQREGWELVERFKKRKWNSETIFEKKLSHHWTLQKLCHEQVGSPVGKGCYWDEHLVYNQEGKLLVMPNWEWAEWLDDSIYYAEKGCLYQVGLKSSDELGDSQLLHDFNDYQFEYRQAPY